MSTNPASQFVLLAPFSGVMVPLETVPDPVFAQKMVGDGISVDPTSNILVAPMTGKVTQIHSAKHAISLTASNGIEVLIHIGLDTVMLKGQGFTAKVKEGDIVDAGQALIEFDMDAVGRKALSLLTQMVITNGEKVSSYTPSKGLVVGGKDVALTLVLADGVVQNSATADASGEAYSDPIRIPNPTGLHARPAAVLANAAKTFKSEVKLVRAGQESNAKSVVAIMGLEVQNGDEIRVRAIGPDASGAIKTLTALILSGCGEDVGGVVPKHKPKPMDTIKITKAQPKSEDPNVLTGVSASPGLAVGQIFQVKQVDIAVAEAGETPEIERRRFDKALKDAHQQLENLKAEISDESKAEIFAAHQELLEDPDLLAIAIAGITNGKSAGFAWKDAYNTYSAKLAALKNEVLAGRANDIRDVGLRVLRLIAGIEETALIFYTAPQSV